MGGEFEGVFFGDIHAANFGELDEFAFDHFLSEVDEDIEDVEIAFFESDLEGLHIEPIAGEDAAVIAPTGIGGRATATGVGAIDHIIVD